MRKEFQGYLWPDLECNPNMEDLEIETLVLIRITRPEYVNGEEIFIDIASGPQTECFCEVKESILCNQASS